MVGNLRGVSVVVEMDGEVVVGMGATVVVVVPVTDGLSVAFEFPDTLVVVENAVVVAELVLHTLSDVRVPDFVSYSTIGLHCVQL